MDTKIFTTAIITGLMLFAVIIITPSVFAQEVTIEKMPNRLEVDAGGTVTYTITVRNTSTSTATDVIVTDTLDADMTLMSASPAVSASAGNNLTWNLGTVGAGETRTITMTVAIDENLSGEEVDLTGNRLLENFSTVGATVGGTTTATTTLSVIEGDPRPEDDEGAPNGVGGGVDELPPTGINPLLLLGLAIPSVLGYLGIRIWHAIARV